MTVKIADDDLNITKKDSKSDDERIEKIKELHALKKKLNREYLKTAKQIDEEIKSEAEKLEDYEISINNDDNNGSKRSKLLDKIPFRGGSDV